MTEVKVVVVALVEAIAAIEILVEEIVYGGAPSRVRRGSVRDEPIADSKRGNLKLRTCSLMSCSCCTFSRVRLRLISSVLATASASWSRASGGKSELRISVPLVIFVVLPFGKASW
jgi:hypothetical protein